MKKFLCCLVSIFLGFGSFVTVHADATYIEYIANTCWDSVNNSYHTYFISDVNVRLVYIKSSLSNADSQKFLYFASTNSGLLYRSIGSSYAGCPVPSRSFDIVNIDNVSYYYVYWSASSVVDKLEKFVSDFNIPTVLVNQYINTLDDINNLGVYYTFGAGSVDPAPPAPVFGDLANVGYNTRITGSGQAAINNLDTVSWNPETDTSGNNISDMSVSVRVVPGKYSASSRQNLYEKLYSDFILNDLGATVLDTVNASSGSFSVTWEDVIDTLALPFATVASIIDQDGTFIKNGWIYQVRLEGDNYTGDWQTVYTATSSGVQNDLTIIQSTTINQTLVNTITEINQLNDTSNNWYINETTINMSDYTEPSQGEKPWWAYLLEAIVSLINKLVDGISSIFGAIANLAGDIIDGILGLFTFDSFNVPDFSTNQQNIHDNSGIFGESIDILHLMNQTISNADSSAEPILYYPGIDLEGVEFIPEITINLNDYVEDLGLTQWHNLAYTCTDIFIWTTLIYTIYRKLIGVFKK